MSGSPRTPRRLERIRAVLSRRQPDLTLVLANIHDPHNVSAIYRSCDAFGIPAVHLYYTDTPFPVVGKKSSASARKWVDTVRHADSRSLFADLKARGMQVLATCLEPEARPLDSFNFTLPTAVIVGNEHQGVDRQLCELADAALYIPMYGMIQSLNVSVAAAVILAEASRQRVLAGQYGRPAWPEDELERLAAEWSGK